MKVHTRTVYQMTDSGEFILLEDEAYEYEGAVAEAKGGGATESSTPWYGVQPNLMNLYAHGGENFESQLSRPQFPGSTVTPFSSQSNQAMGIMEGFGGSDPRYSRQGMESMFGTARGDYLNANPYLDQALNSALDPVQQQINSQFSQAGRYGSGAQAGVLARELGGLRSQAYSDNYARERQNMMEASRFLPQGQAVFDQSILGRAQALGGVGQAMEGKQGEYLQEQMDRFNYPYDQRSRALQEYAGLLQGTAGLGGQTTTSSSGGSRAAGALGGAMMGAQIGSVVPVIGTGIGAIGGGLLGAFA